MDSATSQDGSTTEGMLRNAVLLDRDAEGVQTVFTLAVTYSTPDDSLNNTTNTVSLPIFHCRVEGQAYRM